MATRPRQVVALIPDLMDRSKLSAAVSADPAVEVDFVSSPAALFARADATDRPVDLVVVDLSRPGVITMIEGLRRLAGLRIIGYGSHVDRDLLRSAAEAGCDQVLARSAFFSQLPAVLQAEPGERRTVR
jgi:DNA-binding NarL/FixJ family response regulator